MSIVDAVDFVVKDLEASTLFFQKVFDFTLLKWPVRDPYPVEQPTKRAQLKLGGQKIYLTQFTDAGKPYPKESISSDLSFQHIAIVVSDMELAYDKLQKHNIVPISLSPQTIPESNKAAAGIQAFYFRSLEGHPLELIFYPEGKGREEWQKKGPLFLGIDHTAIAVSDTQKSLAFYQNLLGLKVMGESLNYGETQEKLSGVPGAKVQITGLGDKDGKGMGLEFLHYLEGKKGAASQGRPNDLSSTKTVLLVENLDRLLKKLGAKQLVSKTAEDGKTKAALILDPDGHYVLLTQDLP